MRISIVVLAALLVNSSTASVNQININKAHDDGAEVAAATAAADVVPAASEDEVMDSSAKSEKKEKK
tara:strand:+ start:91 stop:291 length:201 start_codon:yes stop_codon:yes gene_type:complete